VPGILVVLAVRSEEKWEKRTSDPTRHGRIPRRAREQSIAGAHGFVVIEAHPGLEFGHKGAVMHLRRIRLDDLLEDLLDFPLVREEQQQLYPAARPGPDSRRRTLAMRRDGDRRGRLPDIGA